MDQLHYNQNSIVANMQGSASEAGTQVPTAVSTSGEPMVGANDRMVTEMWDKLAFVLKDCKESKLEHSTPSTQSSGVAGCKLYFI